MSSPSKIHLKSNPCFAVQNFFFSQWEKPPMGESKIRENMDECPMTDPSRIRHKMNDSSILWRIHPGSVTKCKIPPFCDGSHQYTPFMLAYIPAPWILWVWLKTILSPPFFIIEKPPINPMVNIPPINPMNPTEWRAPGAPFAFVHNWD